MILYLMLNMIKREQKQRALNQTDLVLMEPMLPVLIMLSIGQ